MSDQTAGPDEWTPLTCILPDCMGELYLSWQMSAPLFHGELAPDADPHQPNDAHEGGWRVECSEGHAILVPDVGPCPWDDCDETCDHDIGELRTWRRRDVERLAKLVAVDALDADRPAPKLATGGRGYSADRVIVDEATAQLSSVIAVSNQFAAAAAGQESGPDWVRLRTGSGRQYEGERSDRCPGDGQPGHQHDIRCVERAEP
jgi:hypothetical protein